MCWQATDTDRPGASSPGSVMDQNNMFGKNIVTAGT